MNASGSGPITLPRSFAIENGVASLYTNEQGGNSSPQRPQQRIEVITNQYQNKALSSNLDNSSQSNAEEEVTISFPTSSAISRVLNQGKMSNGYMKVSNDNPNEDDGDTDETVKGGIEMQNLDDSKSSHPRESTTSMQYSSLDSKTYEEFSDSDFW